MKENFLLEIRKQKGMTQRDVADAVNTTANQISRLETGERQLKPEWLERLSKALNCTKAELLGEAPLYTKHEMEIMDAIRKLPTDQMRDSIYQLITSMSQANEKHADPPIETETIEKKTS